VIRPLRAGDIIAFPYLNAIGRCTGDDSIGSFNWYVPPGGPLSIGRLPNQDETDAMIDSGEIVILETEFDSLAAYHAYRTYRDCDPRLVSPGGASSTGHLSLRAERGSRVRERVNGFLKHPDVAYQHDPVTTPFRIALTATYQDREVAMAVLGRPRGRHNADGRTVELYRFAAHREYRLVAPLTLLCVESPGRIRSPAYVRRCPEQQRGDDVPGRWVRASRDDDSRPE